MSKKRKERMKVYAKNKNIYKNNSNRMQRFMIHTFRETQKTVLIAKLKKNLGLKLTDKELRLTQDELQI